MTGPLTDPAAAPLVQAVIPLVAATGVSILLVLSRIATTEAAIAAAVPFAVFFTPSVVVVAPAVIIVLAPLRYLCRSLSSPSPLWPGRRRWRP